MLKILLSNTLWQNLLKISLCLNIKNSCTYCAFIRSAFSRRPSNLEPIDGLRAIAILWVYVFHAYEYLHKLQVFLTAFFSRLLS